MASMYGRESVVSLPPQRESVAEEFRGKLGEFVQLIPERFNEKFRRTWLLYLSGAAEALGAAREIINCYHITFVKGRFARRGPSAPIDRMR
jgi:hypothetical protein